ncbi:MAG: homoserine O-succinyltransferase [Actinomycetia bacterium]|nr:homoserine O-succinyltransferase [Actinomycetes bacterium]
MPVNVPDGLPAIDILRQENVFLMTEQRSASQDIRPLRIAIVNLMPTKIATETQLLRLLSNTPLQVNASLVKIGGHVSRNTSAEHLEAFYTDSRSIVDERFDGLIVTGAPLETLPFEQVDYWDELCRIFEWSRHHVYRSLFICWGATAALHHFFGIEPRLAEEKLFGIYPMEHFDKSSRLLIGIDDPFWMPQSRYATVLPSDLKTSGLKVLAGSDTAGAVIMASPEHRKVFITGHLEYETDTLDAEYRRDLANGLDTNMPIGYYQNDDATAPIMLRWSTYAHQFFANWLNHYVYQETPYDLSVM